MNLFSEPSDPTPPEAFFIWLRGIIHAMPSITPGYESPPYYEVLGGGPEACLLLGEKIYVRALEEHPELEDLWAQIPPWLDSVQKLTRRGHDLVYEVGVTLGLFDDHADDLSAGAVDTNSGPAEPASGVMLPHERGALCAALLLLLRQGLQARGFDNPDRFLKELATREEFDLAWLRRVLCVDPDAAPEEIDFDTEITKSWTSSGVVSAPADDISTAPAVPTLLDPAVADTAWAPPMSASLDDAPKARALPLPAPVAAVDPVTPEPDAPPKFRRWAIGGAAAAVTALAAAALLLMAPPDEPRSEPPAPLLVSEDSYPTCEAVDVDLPTRSEVGATAPLQRRAALEQFGADMETLIVRQPHSDRDVQVTVKSVPRASHRQARPSVQAAGPKTRIINMPANEAIAIEIGSSKLRLSVESP